MPKFVCFYQKICLDNRKQVRMRLVSQDTICPASPNFTNAAVLVWSPPKLGQTSNLTGLSISPSVIRRKRTLNKMHFGSLLSYPYYNFYCSQMFDPYGSQMLSQEIYSQPIMPAQQLRSYN
jgi:hypothetical protein